MGDSNSRVSEGSDFVVDDNSNENIVHILPVHYKWVSIRQTFITCPL